MDAITSGGIELKELLAQLKEIATDLRKLLSGLRTEIEDDSPIAGKDTKRVREALGLSQSAWAKRLGVQHVSAISRWENGHASPRGYLRPKIRRAAKEAGIDL
jgi:DNA-binding transcriptional regulator YiaG